MTRKIKKRLSCTKCSLKFGTALSKFSTNFAFKLHLTIAHKKKCKSNDIRKKSFKCEKCNYICYKASRLKQHFASVHEDKKPFKCEYCDYNCFQKTNMKRHVDAVHRGKRPFKCELCDYSCTKKGGMNRQVAKVHQGMKCIIICKLCNFSCSTKHHLNQHIASVHEGKTPFKCEIWD